MRNLLFVLLCFSVAAGEAHALTKWDLWTGSTKLRGANIYQRRVYPKLDGTYFLGPGPVGPPYIQQDFDRLSALGANYVNISHPGLFREKPPYKLDPAMQRNLDRLITMIGRADMFAVISFRTGPGRSEFTFFFDDAGTWFDRSYLNDTVWKSQGAQNAWGAMWRYTAQRYRNNPVVAGYDLMVEPNANHVWLDLWDPREFVRMFAGTLYDWNRFFPQITRRIRMTDPATPILVGGMSYSALGWLPYVVPSGDSRTVYTAHQYEPFEYTHQSPPATESYPGRLDLDYDGVSEPFNRSWLNRFFSIFDRFRTEHRRPVASNEFGAKRWLPGVDRFLRDEMTLFEQRRMNYALWVWSGSWPPIVSFDDFDFLHGPDPNNHSDVSSSRLITTIRSFWSRNRIRPSRVVFTDTTGPAVPLCCGQEEVPVDRRPAGPPAPRMPLPHTGNSGIPRRQPL